METEDAPDYDLDSSEDPLRDILDDIECKLECLMDLGPYLQRSGRRVPSLRPSNTPLSAFAQASVHDTSPPPLRDPQPQS